MPFPLPRAHFLVALPLLALACGSGDPSGGGGAGETTTATTTSSTIPTSSSSSTGGSGGTGGTGGAPSNAIISEVTGSYLETETSVVVSPSGVVAAVWISYNNAQTTIGYAFSTDGGASFGPVGFIDGPGGRSAGDPTVAVDAAGNFYASFIAFQIDGGGNASDMGIWVAKAPAGETSFGVPVEISDPAAPVADQIDKPWITITSAGTIVVTYGSFPQTGDLAVIAARSTDGTTWQRSFVAHDPNGGVFRNLAQPCAPAGGSRLYATWLAYGSSIDVELGYSDDEGATWSTPIVVNKQNELPTADDPNCVAAGNDVWVMYATGDGSGNPNDSQPANGIQLAHSSDGAATIADRLAAHDTAVGPLYLHPQMIREDGGAIDLVYYSGTVDQDDFGSYRRSRRPASGGAFGPSVALESPLTFLGARSDGRWLGDYTGIAWSAGHLYTTYATNPTGYSHVAFAKVTP